MTEHRKSSRRIFRVPTMVSMASGQNYLARSYDLGIGGMCVITPVQLETDSHCTVGFEVPLAPLAGQDGRISASGRIVYCIPCAEGFKTGLQFTDLDAAGRQALRDFLGYHD